jgi:hypothetical protein
MAAQLNKEALAYAKELIKQGKYDNSDESWKDKQPSTEEENDFIEKNNITEYGKWHLGIDAGEGTANKGRYKFPFGDFKKVHRDGLIAIKQRAGQNDYQDIEKAADELLNSVEQAGNQSKSTRH